MDYHINDAKVDAEHAELLQLLDSLARVADSVPPEDLSERLAKLKDHVVIHFVDEEFIFEKQYDMPADYVTRHKDEHRRLRDGVLTKIAGLRGAGSAAVPGVVAEVRSQLENHIRTMDAEMNLYIPEKGAPPARTT